MAKPQKEWLGVVELTALAIKLALLVIEQINLGQQADKVLTNSLFRRLCKVIAALPPSHLLSHTFWENMSKWPLIPEGGDVLATRYQLVLLVAKLRLFRDDWDGGSACGARLNTPYDSPKGSRAAAVRVGV